MTEGVELAMEPTSSGKTRQGSAQAFARESRVVPGGSMRQASWFAPHPPYAARGEGCWIIDVDERRILDCANNFFSLIHGHAFPPVVEALREAMGAGTAFGLPTESEILLAELLATRDPRLAQTRFCNSGTEAVMHAIKGARGVTGRHRIAKFEGCYHGSYDHAEISLDAAPANWDTASGDLASVAYVKGTPAAVLADTVVLPYDDPDRCASILKREGPTLAAVLVDPHASRVGMLPMSKEVVEVVQEACRRDGVMLILDEVINFRLGYGGTAEYFDFEPDFVTTAKIIGGGLPIGAVSGRRERMAVYDHTQGKPAVAMGGTFSANPLSMVAGIATLTHFDQPAVDRLNAAGDTLRQNVNAAFADMQSPARLTGMGSLFKLHLGTRPMTGYRSSYPKPSEAASFKAIHAALLDAGVLLTPNCSGALSTPMTDQEIASLAEALIDAVRTHSRDGRS